MKRIISAFLVTSGLAAAGYGGRELHNKGYFKQFVERRIPTAQNEERELPPTRNMVYNLELKCTTDEPYGTFMEAPDVYDKIAGKNTQGRIQRTQRKIKLKIDKQSKQTLLHTNHRVSIPLSGGKSFFISYNLKELSQCKSYRELEKLLENYVNRDRDYGRRKAEPPDESAEERRLINELTRVRREREASESRKELYPFIEGARGLTGDSMAEYWEERISEHCTRRFSVKIDFEAGTASKSSKGANTPSIVKSAGEKPGEDLWILYDLDHVYPVRPESE